ncbi:hypothetical protein LguiB_028231 [Lonicera macranthoides]
MDGEEMRIRFRKYVFLTWEALSQELDYLGVGHVVTVEEIENYGDAVGYLIWATISCESVLVHYFGCLGLHNLNNYLTRKEEEECISCSPTRSSAIDQALVKSLQSADLENFPEA